MRLAGELLLSTLEKKYGVTCVARHIFYRGSHIKNISLYILYGDTFEYSPDRPGLVFTMITLSTGGKKYGAKRPESWKMR